MSPGTVFFCVRGFVHDGHDFIPEALSRGATSLVVEGADGWAAARASNAPVIVQVASVREVMGRAAANFFGHPSRKLRVIGVTGTNGKTTTTHLIREMLVAAGRSCGLIGTVHNVAGGESLPAARTTPEAFDLQRLARRMVKAGDTHLCMEVGSHALALGRVNGFEFDGAVFTNLTQDHLDFHLSLENYFQAKAKLFEAVRKSYLGWPKPGPKTCVLNADDPASARLAAMTSARVVTYGLTDGSSAAGVWARDLDLRSGRTGFTLRLAEGLGAGLPAIPAFEGRVELSMTGRHNVANALAALAVALIEGVPLGVILASLGSLEGASGRFETVDAGQAFTAVVDYAHTPDGLENVLAAARALHPARLIAVFGCGGDRDRTKRPLMGKVVGRLADFCVVTSDNPRTEEPGAIIEDIKPGLTGLGLREGHEFVVEPDRAKAINLAVRLARPGDLVLVAGKGHETYQTFADGNIHFDDREVLREAISGAGRESGNLSRGAGDDGGSGGTPVVG